MKTADLMRMVEVQTSNASAEQLNWLVARCTVVPDVRDGRARFWLHRNNPRLVCVQAYNYEEFPQGYAIFAPATEPRVGMPILMGRGIVVKESVAWREFQDADRKWAAASETGVMATGPTELMAGLRCLVGSLLGDVVQVPAALADELVMPSGA